jgi:hypothetical protein
MMMMMMMMVTMMIIAIMRMVMIIAIMMMVMIIAMMMMIMMMMMMITACHRHDPYALHCSSHTYSCYCYRLIDRPVRPMIMDGWQHETQLLTWLLSYDKVGV